MPRLTVDIEKLMVGLYAAVLTGVAVKAAPDVDAVDSLPLLVVSPVTGAMVSNGFPGGGWEWLIEVTVLAEGHGTAADLADSVYQKTHGFEDARAKISGVGVVVTVEDREMPRRVATSVHLNNLTQFTGTFALVVRPA